MYHFDFSTMTDDEIRQFKLACRKAGNPRLNYQIQDAIHELYYHAEQERRVRFKREVSEAVHMQHKGVEHA